MAKFERILNFFPGFYTATDQSKLLRKVIRMLAEPIENADTELFRIQRAHRLKVAEHANDIVHLAGVLNLTSFYFEDILNDKTIDYSQKLDLMRQRVQRIAEVHLEGLGTPSALMEVAAIFLNGKIVPENSGDPIIKPILEGTLSHKAMIEFTYLSEKSRERIYLHENPLHRIKVEPDKKWPMNSWVVINQNAESSSAKLVIQGIDDRTVLPGIFCSERQEGIVFNGIVPDGKTLVIDENRGATLDNISVDKWIIYFKGGIFNFNRSDASTFAIEHGGSNKLFDGGIEEISLDPFQKNTQVPQVPVGSSKWHFKVAEGVFDSCNFNFSVYATTHKPIGKFDEGHDFDNCVFDFPASGIAGMAWDEQLTCCFKLLLPNHIPQQKNPDSEDGLIPRNMDQDSWQSQDYVSRIGNILHRFKAAGIQAFVDKAKDAWILGESVLRNSTANEGEGVEFHSTILQYQKVDIFVPLDTIP